MDNNLPVNLFVSIMLGGVAVGGLYRGAIILQGHRRKTGSSLLAGAAYLVGGLASLTIAVSLVLYMRGI